MSYLRAAIMMRRLLMLALLMSVFVAGCKDDETSEWTLTLGSSGGFTGGGSGYRVEADGKVTSWTRLTAKAELTTTPIGTASEGSMKTLSAALTSPELRKVELSESGNMTAFLEWKHEDETRRYSWPEGTSPPEPVARLREAALAAVEDARAHK